MRNNSNLVRKRYDSCPSNDEESCSSRSGCKRHPLATISSAGAPSRNPIAGKQTCGIAAAQDKSIRRVNQADLNGKFAVREGLSQSSHGISYHLQYSTIALSAILYFLPRDATLSFFMPVFWHN